MAYDLEEQEQLATLRGWWKDHGAMVVLVVVALAVAFSTWQGWRWYQMQQASEASALYESLLKSIEAGDVKGVRDSGGTLVESYPGRLQASMAALAQARFFFDRGDLKSAAAQLQWVIERSPSDAFRALARLRLASVLLDEKAYDAALAQLEPPPAGPFAAQYAALKGDILVAKQQSAQAAAAYRVALEKASKDDQAFVESVRMRLEALGG
ncbi:MAG: tetratricopeptide repeat protein [Burkholderiales bacterium]|nr:tetratricopeptide repeat protein [Burkholderiales bacterium]